MTRMTTARAVITSLTRNGIDTLYCLPGVQNDQFFNALFDEGNSIRAIHTRHEQGSAYMALGHAMATGKPAAYCVVPGPGLLNTTAALSTAYGNSAPVLCLTGQVPSKFIGAGTGQLHEIPEQLTHMKALSKWADRIEGPADAPGKMNEAFRQLLNGRPRPVGIECAMDVWGEEGSVAMDDGPVVQTRPPVDEDAIISAAKLLGSAKNPMIFVGGGALHASEEVKTVAEILQAPVIAGRMGRGVLDSRHYLSLAPQSAYDMWPEVDVVLAVGTRLQGPKVTWGLGDCKVIHIDLDGEEMNRTARPEIGIMADSQDAMAALANALEKHADKRASREEEMLGHKADLANRIAKLKPQLAFLKVMREELPEDGIFVDELTQAGYVSRFAFPVYSPRTFISTGYQGTLGYGFATALGVKTARPDVPVLAISGDGGFMFNVQELSTAVQQRIPLVTVVFSDGAFGNVKRMQKELYDNRVIGSDLHNPDFAKLAELFGAQGLTANDPEELRAAIRKGFSKTDGPTIIEVPVGEMPSPWEFIIAQKNRG